MIAVRHFRSFFVWRWWVCLWRARKGVYIHPSALLNGSPKHVLLGRGTKVGARSRLSTDRDGQVITGERIWLSTDVEIETATKVYIGEGTTIQRRCTINGTVRIGAGCIFAPNVFVSSGTHPFREIPWLPIREQEKRIIAANGSLVSLDRPVWIQDDCWLGINVVVCPGVTIGKGSVVGANSVVVKDVAPYSIVAGVPAKVIGQRLEWRPKSSLKADCTEDAPYILSGLIRVAFGNTPAGVQVTSEVPFCAVLDVGAESCRVRYTFYVTHEVEVLVCDRVYNIAAGDSALEVNVVSSKDACVDLYLEILDRNYVGCFLIGAVKVVY